MSYKVEPLPNSFADLGEGPHWDIARQCLYYVDIFAGRLLRYDYETDKVYSCKINGENFASFVIPIDGRNDKFAIGCARRVVIVSWNGVSPICDVDRILFEVQTEEKYQKNRFNDGKCDPNGRLFAGTMLGVGDIFTSRLGQLFKYEKDGKVEIIKSDIGISNGLTWNQELGKFYFIDSNDFDIKEYDYDLKSGVASNPKTIYKLPKANPNDHSLPDGMTIDTEGNLYVAVYNGSKVIKLDPRTRNVLLEIKLPCKQITSVAFGGPNLDILYVTTAAQMEEPAPAGTTYKVTGLGAKGLPMASLKI